MKITRSDRSPLTSDERKNNIKVDVKHSERMIYHMYEYADESQTNETIQNLNYAVPENGIIQIEFPVPVNTTVLKVKVYIFFL